MLPSIFSMVTAALAQDESEEGGAESSSPPAPHRRRRCISASARVRFTTVASRELATDSSGSRPLERRLDQEVREVIVAEGLAEKLMAKQRLALEHGGARLSDS